jgi:hypothetical protein
MNNTVTLKELDRFLLISDDSLQAILELRAECKALAVNQIEPPTSLYKDLSKQTNLHAIVGHVRELRKAYQFGN